MIKYFSSSLSSPRCPFSDPSQVELAIGYHQFCVQFCTSQSDRLSLISLKYFLSVDKYFFFVKIDKKKLIKVDKNF